MSADLASLTDRFWSKVTEHPDGCWIWTGARVPNGYGQWGSPDGVRVVHRLTYEALIGDVPDGMQLDHTCRRRECCNPWHLDVVTNRVNTLRGAGPTAINAAKTACVAGHPLSGENVRVTPKGHRSCRACDTARVRARRAALRAA